ncbi:hypothetical protein [Pseudomonas sp. NPDC089401]|uniref:hypothetical protein n=1 Tax=Pseudomonas sp. NPDC089401 TaxID=3364462 RepID=UPI0037FDCF9E
MQASDKELVEEVRLLPEKQDYRVTGFFKAYETYSEACADKRHGAGVLTVIGIAIAALGLGVWIFGPSTIYYDRLSGPSFVQHMQIAPHLVVSVGVLFLALAKKVRGEAALTPELFLLCRYKVIGIDGSEAKEQVDIRYLGEDDFTISLRQSS